jgi:hypothetical protein
MGKLLALLTGLAVGVGVAIVLSAQAEPAEEPATD